MKVFFCPDATSSTPAAVAAVTAVFLSALNPMSLTFVTSCFSSTPFSVYLSGSVKAFLLVSTNLLPSLDAVNVLATSVSSFIAFTTSSKVIFPSVGATDIVLFTRSYQIPAHICRFC